MSLVMAGIKSWLIEEWKKQPKWTGRLHQVRNLISYGCVDPVEFYVLKDLELVYVVNSKAACTSIKYALAKHYNLKHEGKFIHSHIVWEKKVKDFELNTHQLDREFQNFFKFTFVRNPYQRLYSCYVNKVEKGAG